MLLYTLSFLDRWASCARPPQINMHAMLISIKS